MTKDQLLAALTHDNVSAFLRVIRQKESNQSDDAYRLVVGGGHYDGDLAAHPRIAIKTKWGWSSAFGAYQIMAVVEGKVKTDTYDRLASALGPSMEPLEQDLKAVLLIKWRGALDTVMGGRLDEAIRLCNREWASLPGSPYGQPTQTLKDCHKVFAAHGGRVSPSPVLPSPPTVETQTKVNPS